MAHGQWIPDPTFSCVECVSYNAFCMTGDALTGFIFNINFLLFNINFSRREKVVSTIANEYFIICHGGGGSSNFIQL